MVNVNKNINIPTTIIIVTIIIIIIIIIISTKQRLEYFSRWPLWYWKLGYIVLTAKNWLENRWKVPSKNFFIFTMLHYASTVYYRVCPSACMYYVRYVYKWIGKCTWLVISTTF